MGNMREMRDIQKNSKYIWQKIHSQDSWRKKNTFKRKKKTRRKYLCLYTYSFISSTQFLHTHVHICASVYKSKKKSHNIFYSLYHDEKEEKKNIKSSFSFFNFCAFHRFSYVKRMHWNGGVSGRQKYSKKYIEKLK